MAVLSWTKFNVLVKRAAEATRIRDLARAEAQLEDALGLWSAIPPLSNVPSVDLITDMLPTAKDRSTSVIVLIGPPGIGKTSLAVRTAHQVAERFADGQLFADLRGQASGELSRVLQVLSRFIRALDPARPLGLDDQVLAYRSVLAERNVLIIPDNAARAAEVRTLLPGSAGCAVLVTSATNSPA